MRGQATTVGVRQQRQPERGKGAVPLWQGNAYRDVPCHLGNTRHRFRHRRLPQDVHGGDDAQQPLQGKGAQADAGRAVRPRAVRHGTFLCRHRHYPLGKRGGQPLTTEPYYRPVGTGDIPGKSHGECRAFPVSVTRSPPAALRPYPCGVGKDGAHVYRHGVAPKQHPLWQSATRQAGAGKLGTLERHRMASPPVRIRQGGGNQRIHPKRIRGNQPATTAIYRPARPPVAACRPER